MFSSCFCGFFSGFLPSHSPKTFFGRQLTIGGLLGSLNVIVNDCAMCELWWLVHLALLPPPTPVTLMKDKEVEDGWIWYWSPSLLLTWPWQSVHTVYSLVVFSSLVFEPLLIHDAPHGSPMIVHQYLWSSVLGTEAAVVTSSLYIDMNEIFFSSPLVTVHLHITLDNSALIISLISIRLNLHSRLKIEAESHGHWSKISVAKSQLSRRCVSTALRVCICPFCLSGPVSYQQPGEHWQ